MSARPEAQGGGGRTERVQWMLRRHEEHRPVKFESKVIDRQFHAVVAQLAKTRGQPLT